ncbi:MAG: single-stranded-DNA-specific exonuclease RecJ [Anaerolineae bacterium]|nr:single-stranded-DNA-specific exonuclease RecJ [Anaerolineae bacterium]
MFDSAGTAKRWRVPDRAPRHVLDNLNSYHPVMAQVLYNRGQDTAEKAQRFLDGGDTALHNPFSMHGMSEAVGRVRKALKDDELIAIYGDFDADGVTSTALLTQALEALGGRVRPYIPNRVDEGYGLNNEALKTLHSENVKLVITVDCGIRSVDEVAFAQSIGLDMIVTDHHSLGETLPPALAVLDPKIDARRRQEEGRTNGYPEDMLAGVGVAYKLAEALFAAASKQGGFRPTMLLEDLLDLVALGTVADLAPLDRIENRELVRRGLDVLSRAQRPGIYELMRVAGIDPERQSATTTTIAFMLGPRINAAGRLDNAIIACDLLMSDMPEAGKLAQQLQELNVKRQQLTVEAVENARERILAETNGDVSLIFDAGVTVPHGIVGLVAGRLCEEYYRPAVVIGQDEDKQSWRGSCRSIPEFNITQALDQCADLLIRHGGHAQAAGFTVRDENVQELRERLAALAAEALHGQELRPTLDIDAEVPFDQLTMGLAEALNRLEPTGASNSAPLLKTERLRVVEARTVGREGKHLRLKVSNGLTQVDGIAFRQGDWADRLPDYIDVVYHLEINEWNGHTRLQMNVQDIAPST